MSTQETQYFVDSNGIYLGGFEGAEPPEGAIEVVSPPEDGRDTWNGSAWVSFVSTAPDIPGFFNDLVLTILAGGLPQDVHPKAKMVEDILAPADQAIALTTLAQDPSYTKDQKATLDGLITKHHLALPTV